MRDALGLAGVVLLIAWIVMHLAGCWLWPHAAITAEAAVYERELDACLVEARDAGRSMAVYDQCAREADKRHNLDGGK